jgi:hypothetical protein
MRLAAVRDLREARAPAGPEELAAFDPAGLPGAAALMRLRAGTVRRAAV